MNYIFLSALGASLLCLSIIPLVIYLAGKNKWFDEVNERKIHSGNIARLGGIGIFWSFAISFTVVSLIFSKDASLLPWGEKYWVASLSLIVIHVMGLADDFLNLKARFRIVIQVLLAAAVTVAGFRFNNVFIPFVNINLELGWFSYILTGIWLVGITNAINFIDGLDGLSGGISIIASATYGIIFIENGDVFSALMAFTLVGSLTAYLFYNFPPARIFMGDSGSTFLGFILALLPLLGKQTVNSNVTLWIAITILLVPIFDTFAAIWRRKKKGVSPFSPDRFHLHHKLMNLGFSTRQILAIVYAVCMALGGVAVSSVYLDNSITILLVIAAWFICTVLFTVLHYLKEKNVVLINKK